MYHETQRQGMLMKVVKWTTVIASLTILSLFVLFKPARVLIPEVNGVRCATGSICIDDLSRLQQAESLLADAVIDVERKLTPLNDYPRAIFCSTQVCYEKFGFEQSAASAVGSYAVVIGPRGWEAHYLKHELIHYWQAENLGVIRMLMMDEWFREGMAYLLSDDPRRALHEPFQTYRSRFADWYNTAERDNMAIAVGQYLQADTP
jgi:hypothetical protein